jgi:hypothetical protein
MKPLFSNSLPSGTVGPVVAGDQIFTKPTYSYANEVTTEMMGSGGTQNYAYSCGKTPVRPNTVKIMAVIAGNTDVTVDNGSGGLIGANLNTALTNTIVYTGTGAGSIQINYAAPPDPNTSIFVQYQWNSEANTNNINEIEFNLVTVPVQARIHPLKFTYSVAAGLAASAHLAIDVQDTLAELAGQFMKNERDNQVLRLINQNATHYTTLYFDASCGTPGTPMYFDRQSRYSDIQIKIDEAEALIQNKMGRGGVSWMLCGRNVANMMRQTKGFTPAPVIAPIGAHVIGYTRDGTVPIIKDLRVTQPDDYIVGYKGYMAGDAATILAEWIPIYFTPVFQAPTLQNQQGLMSMYDLFVNNSGYYAKGTCSNYTA